MREIKFRAWDALHKEMVFIDMYTLLDGYRTCDFRVLFQEGSLSESMQFTGLHDKNGKEIYEGDILDGHCDGVVKVIWKDTSWEVEFADGAGIGLDEMCMWFGNNSEVIGNIYENPEL